MVLRAKIRTRVTHMMEPLSGVPASGISSVVYIGANTAINLQWEKEEEKYLTLSTCYELEVVLAVSWERTSVLALSARGNCVCEAKTIGTYIISTTSSNNLNQHGGKSLTRSAFISCKDLFEGLIWIEIFVKDSIDLIVDIQVILRKKNTTSEAQRQRQRYMLHACALTRYRDFPDTKKNFV